MRFNGFDNDHHHHVNVYVETDVTMSATCATYVSRGNGGNTKISTRVSDSSGSERIQQHRSECVTQYQSSAAAAIGEPTLTLCLSVPLSLSLYFSVGSLPSSLFPLSPARSFFSTANTNSHTLPSKPLPFFLLSLSLSPSLQLLSTKVYRTRAKFSSGVEELNSIKNSDAQLGQMV